MEVWSPESPQFDIGELQVAHDLQLVNAAQVLHPMSELKQVWAVDRQLELVGLTQDENLTEKRSLQSTQPKRNNNDWPVVGYYKPKSGDSRSPSKQR